MMVTPTLKFRGQAATCLLVLLVVLAAGAITTSAAAAAEYTFGWAANPEPVDGYKLYYKKGGAPEPPFNGTDSAKGPSPIDLGKQTSFTITGLDNTATYHFALTAYHGSDESGFTQVITVNPQEDTVPPPPTGGTAATPPYGEKRFTFNWEPSTETGITSYRFYINDKFLCASTTPGATSLSCNAVLLKETMYFSMTTVDSLGTESAKSNVLTYEPPPPSKAFLFKWDATAASGITSRRFYINGRFLCESTDPATASLTCYADLLGGPMSFSMSTVDSLGIESAQSNVLVYDPAGTTASPLGPAAILQWQYDAAASVLGYRIYHNGTLLEEISDPGASGYTSQAPLSETNIFEVYAYDGSGNEVKIDSTVSYTGTPAGTDTDALAAVIIANKQKGQGPLTVTFDAGASTGPINTYTWSFGDGDTAQGTTATHTYNFAGAFTATLTVADQSGATRQANIGITVTAPAAPEPAGEPVAVIASSSAVGEAPFTVNFDGSGSSTPNPPITSYSWDFGDGTSGTGISASHTYSLPGTYYPSLTVRDSANLTDAANTPVIITQGQSVNTPPSSVFTAAPGYGTAPLAVSFDGSGSRDAEGSIKSYHWNFGDGTTGTGVSVQHTFSTPANYTVTLQVTDNLGETAVSSQVIAVRAPGEAKFYFELWEAQVTHSWTRFNFKQAFKDPVVVTGPPSFNDPDPVTVRVRNVDPNGCEIRLQEWEHQDGVHASETLSFLVMERGAHTTDNGGKIEAGTFTGATSFKRVDLQQQYSNVPIILSQVITENEADAVVGRLRNITAASFEYTMQERELTPTAHGAETIGYIAWEPGEGEVLGLPYKADLTAQTITDAWSDLVLQTEDPASPLLIAQLQTNIESGPAALRSRVTPTSLQIKVEEETSADEETIHMTEVVGSVIIGEKAASETGSTSSLIKNFTFTWESAISTNIAGYRFYLNGSVLCETTDPAARQYTCKAGLLNETMNFSMTSVLSDGTETEPTVVLSISPDDYPDVFGIHLATFEWQYDASAESSIAGFAVYNNDSLVCDTMKPSDRKLTCKVQIDSKGNAFSIRARALNGTETGFPNTLQYIPW